MTDGNLPNSEQYLVTVLKDTGDTIFHRVRCNYNGHWETFGAVPREELPFGPALTIGEKVLAIQREKTDDCRLGEPHLHTHSAESGYPHMIALVVEPKPPKPLTGLGYLKSLPDGAQFRTPTDELVTKLSNGLHWVDGEVWLWGGLRRAVGNDRLTLYPWETNSWVENASVETLAMP